MSDKVKLRVDLRSKEDKSNKVTSLSENSTNTQYPSAKTVYDELMTVRTVTPPTHIIGISPTVNNVTKNESLSHINSYDLEYFEKIVYNINFEDNDFQMFFQQGSNDSNMQIIYFDGNDCYWGEADDNTGDLTQGSLICEGNIIQATLNKNKTITIGNTIVNWNIDGAIVMFGNVDFTYTIYSHKYLDADFPYTFIYGDSSMVSAGDYTVNSITKDSGGIYLSTDLDNAIEKIYTITFNDDDFSYLDYGDTAIYFDGTDCYWGQWDENDNSVLNKGTLICEGNVVQATYLSGNGNSIYFPDGKSIPNMDYSLGYFGDVNIKVKNKVLALEYVSNKTLYLTDSFDDSICYPSVATLKDYAEDKSNKVTSWSNTTTDIHYPSEKLVKDSLDGKANSTHTHTKNQITDFPTLHTVATSGSYNDLSNKPNIPSKTSDLTNDSGFLTSHQSLSGYLQTSDVKDNLTSTDTNKPLSANQGKELKSLIDNKPTVTVDSSWVANSTNPIQSKEIKTALDGKANVIDFYYDNLTDELVINTSTETDFEDLILKEDKSNKVSSWSNTPDNNHYPTEKLVKDYIDEMIGDILEYINS